MVETYARPRFGEPREPKNRVNPGSRFVGVVDFVTGSHVRAIAFLILCGLLMFLPGFFNIPPIDRDEARFAQATKQMVETSDFVDIRFQDDVRYKKPVGIYWLQAAAVETASALGLQRAQVRIWLYRVPSLIGAIGAVLLTYWTALAFVTRRGAVLAGLILCSSVLLGVEARLAKTDAMLLLTVVAAMGSLAWVYLSWQRGEDPVRPPWTWPAIFWTALAGGILLKGPLILMFVALTIVTLVILDRSAEWLWRLRPVWGLMWMLVLVLPWFVAIFWRAGDTFFAEFDRRRHAEQAGRAGVARRTARTVSAHVLGDVLAGSTASRNGGAGGLAGEARARRAIPAGVAAAFVDRIRTGVDQTAALRAATLPGNRYPRRRRAGAPRAVAIMAEARRRLVVPYSGCGLGHRRGRRHRADASTCLSGVAVRGSGVNLGAVRVVAL